MLMPLMEIGTIKATKLPSSSFLNYIVGRATKSTSPRSVQEHAETQIAPRRLKNCPFHWPKFMSRVIQGFLNRRRTIEIPDGSENGDPSLGY